MKKLFALVLLLFIHSLDSFSQSTYMKDKSETSDVSQKVTKLFSESKIAEAVVLLSLYWPLPQNEISSIESQTVKYLNVFNERFGKVQGIEKGKTETINDFAIREVYFIKYSNHAIRLIFIYYRGEKGWIINSFKWDDSFEKEF